MCQTDLNKDRFGYPAVNDASPGNPKHMMHATNLPLMVGLEVGGWRLVAEVVAKVSGWLECVSMCEFIVKFLFQISRV